MNIADLFNKDSEYGNFVCVYFGLAYVSQILEPYTRHGLGQVYQKIQKVLAGKPPCAGKCGKNQPGWCNSCKDWKRELTKFSKSPNKIDWKNQESSKWPISYEHIASVFTSTPEDGGLVNLRDISNACKIWKNCSVFNIQPFARINAKNSRNNYFAHNPKLRVTSDQKTDAFDALNDLLKQGDVQHYINKQECLNELEKIKNGKNDLPNEIASISENIKKISNDEDKIVKILTELTESGTEERKVLKRIQYLVIALHERQRREHAFVTARLDFIMNILLSILLSAAFCIVVVSLLVYISPSYPQGEEQRPNVIPTSIGSKYSGCLNESYKYPFPLKVPMLGFLPTQNQLVGREWVFDELEKKMFEQNSKSRGTLMIAGYGFGKSAIVAHLLCARENEKGWKLRQHIVAFHVCKFTHESTKNPVQLIKRLIWFLSIKDAEYGSHIALLNDSIITDDEKCKEETKLCFDLAITNPLDKLTVPNDSPWIVVIDALDECEDDNGRNRILELLADRLTSMQQEGPKWFKWLITSRNKPSLNKLNKLDTVHLLYDDERNYDDIRHFIINQLNIIDKDTVKRFVSKSGGNILYIKHALGYIIESGNASIHNIVDLPSGIEEIYELNFDRLFKTNNDFEVAKSILEVISVFNGPVRDKRPIFYIFKVIEVNKITNKTEFVRIMDKLSDYVSSDGAVTFRHKSLYEWLFSDTKSNYRLSRSLGHTMVSEYIFFGVNRLDATDTSPFIYNNGCMYNPIIFQMLTYHVSESQNSSIQRKYFSFQLLHAKYNYPFEDVNAFCYIGVVTYNDIHSIKMLSLIVNFVKNKTVENNRFIRFIHNVYENYVSYRFLLFNVMDAVSFIYENVTNAKDILKYPLHTAARYCREDVALYLINVVKVSLLERDNNDMRAIDVAARSHCVPVIKLITEKDRSVFDLECLMNVECINSGAAIEIYKMLEANKVKPTCFDTSLQKEMLMRIYFNSPRRRRYIFSNENVCTEEEFQPELLFCLDSFGYTLALQFITIDARYSFLAVLDKHISDKCQHVSSSMLYMFYLIMYRSTLKDWYPSHSWKRLSHRPICPEGASVEHLLMQYKRIEMIDLVIAKGHIMNWTKTDRKGMTPLNYTDQMFISQLECRFGDVDIHVLSDKDKLVRLCLCDWLYFYLLLVLYAIACCIASFYCVVLYSIETILYKVVFL
ncbi:uncharacterized protein LOC123561553 [Mercenaria mercenaria]|uniref:uncharacterized protein LOC123561553 n=1 Tax=Mercenaria mercenaria TaxID=6596 RepID=UPI00234F0262|nr:uncharacterized protein LOC123561553 [Mercenaria mercenaria]